MRPVARYFTVLLLAADARVLFGQATYWLRLAPGFAIEQENCGTCPTPDLVGFFGCIGVVGAGLHPSQEHPAFHLGLEFGAWKEYAWQSQVQKTYIRTLVVDYRPPRADSSRWRARFGMGTARHFPTRGEGNRGTTFVVQVGVGRRDKTFSPMLVAYYALDGRHDASPTKPAGPYRPLLIAMILEKVIE